MSKHAELKKIFPNEDHSSNSWLSFVREFGEVVQKHRSFLNDKSSEFAETMLIKSRIKQFENFLKFLKSDYLPFTDGNPDWQNGILCTDFKTSKKEKVVRDSIVPWLDLQLERLEHELQETKKPRHRPSKQPSRALFCEEIAITLYMNLGRKLTLSKQKTVNEKPSETNQFIVYGIRCLEDVTIGHNQAYGLIADSVHASRKIGFYDYLDEIKQHSDQGLVFDYDDSGLIRHRWKE